MAPNSTMTAPATIPITSGMVLPFRGVACRSAASRFSHSSRAGFSSTTRSTGFPSSVASPYEDTLGETSIFARQNGQKTDASEISFPHDGHFLLVCFSIGIPSFEYCLLAQNQKTDKAHPSQTLTSNHAHAIVLGRQTPVQRPKGKSF